MKRVDPVWLDILSDLFVNLSAGWFATIFIGTNFFGLDSTYDFLILTGDFVAAIVSLYLSYRLRKITKLLKKA